MSDEATRPPEAGPEEPVPEAGSPEAGSPEAGSPEAGSPEAGSPEAGSPEAGDYLAKWQRARADYQNLKRRTFEDIRQAVQRERGALLQELLTVLDHMDMALGTEVEGEEARNLQVGVRMTRDQLWSLLERHQVAPIDTEGQFDIDRHQALATVESADHDPGEIVEVVRGGFTVGDAVLRYAQVKVAAAPEAGTAEGQDHKREDSPAEGDDQESA